MGFTSRDTWCESIEQFLEHERAGEAPASTLATLRHHLLHAGRRLPAGPWSTTGAELVAYFAAQSWAAETRRGHRTTLRRFYAWALELGFVTESPATALPKVKPGPPRPRPTPARAVQTALADTSPRTVLMVRLALQMGLRRGEVARIHPRRDVLEDLAGWSLIVHGKGGKTRVVPIPDDLVGDVVHAAGDGYLFPGNVDGRLSERWVGRLVADALPDHWTMHSLRHHFATKFHRAHGDVLALQLILGHASPVTTRMYVEVDVDKLRRQMMAAA